MTDREAGWTLRMLGDLVARALSVDYRGTRSRRVRDVPDARTIRYYTTRGLIDRPARWRGRIALYGRRHLLQIVAIKRLQARGLSLAAIERRLTRESDDTLAEIARLPPDLDIDVLGAPPPATTERDPVSRAPAARLLNEVRLEDGVTLLVESDGAADDEDVDAVRDAATPLLDALRRRGLPRGR